MTNGDRVALGAGFTMDLLFLRAERARNPADLGKTGEFQEWLVPRRFIPFGAPTLLFVFDGAAQESNLPSDGLRRLTGFEDRLGHRARAAPLRT